MYFFKLDAFLDNVLHSDIFLGHICYNVDDFRYLCHVSFIVRFLHSLLCAVFLDYSSLLERYGTFIAKHFADARIVNIGVCYVPSCTLV